MKITLETPDPRAPRAERAPRPPRAPRQPRKPRKPTAERPARASTQGLRPGYAYCRHCLQVVRLNRRMHMRAHTVVRLISPQVAVRVSCPGGGQVRKGEFLAVQAAMVPVGSIWGLPYVVGGQPVPEAGEPDGEFCCTPDSGDCCGPGSWCCQRAGAHEHPELVDAPEWTL